jgi:hypothetical protein
MFKYAGFIGGKDANDQLMFDVYGVNVYVYGRLPYSEDGHRKSEIGYTDNLKAIFDEASPYTLLTPTVTFVLKLVLDETVSNPEYLSIDIEGFNFGGGDIIYQLL